MTLGHGPCAYRPSSLSLLASVCFHAALYVVLMLFLKVCLLVLLVQLRLPHAVFQVYLSTQG